MTLAEQVQCGLGAGEVAEGLGAAYVEGLGRAECLLQCSAVDEGLVEVEGVGDVEVGLEVQGAGVVHVVAVDRDVPRVDGEVAVLRIRGRVRGSEVEPLDGLRDQPVELGATDPTGHGSDLRVDPPSRLDGQRRGSMWMVVSATSRARQDGTAPEWTCAHSRGRRWRSSRAWPMSFFAAVDEMPEDGAELGDAELRHQRATLAGDGFLVLAARDRERGGGVDRLGWVEVGPPGRDLEELRGCLVLSGLAVTSQREQVGGREVR